MNPSYKHFIIKIIEQFLKIRSKYNHLVFPLFNN